MSKEPAVSYQLITKLLEKNHVRGIDAAGFWGVDSDGTILFHKEPGKSTEFTQKDAWKSLAARSPHLLITHSRGASKGVGEPQFNENNHPFVNNDQSIGLIHNGRIEPHEYDALKEKYPVQSACDSEILLRIFETYKNSVPLFDGQYLDRLSGISDIFSFINDGQMAVAIGQKTETDDLLWLFRNRHRPVWIADMREPLGQIFFVSEPRVWDRAVRECKGTVKKQTLVSLPQEEIWFLRIVNNMPTVKRFFVEKTVSQ